MNVEDLRYRNNWQEQSSCSLDEAPLFFPVLETELREKARIEYDIAKEKGYLKYFKIKWEPLIRNKFIEDVVI